MFLSICIPSYNRLLHLKELVESILIAQSNDFELVIVDNGSSFDICKEFRHCHDKRLRIIKRELVVGGPTNVRLVLDEAKGEYAMVCLDKDYIIGSEIDEFINQLKTIKHVACGYCLLNTNGSKPDFVTSEDLVNNIYRCGHPSGTFFKTDLIKGDTQELNLGSKASVYYNNPFLIDLIFAKSLSRGKQAIYEGKLIRTETLEEAAKNKSYSYCCNKNNLYFTPKNKIKQFWVFVHHMEKLPIVENDKKKIIKKLIRSTLYDVSIGYKRLLSDELLCKHYGIRTATITRKTMIINVSLFIKSFKTYNTPIITKRNSFNRILVLEKLRIVTRLVIERY